MNIITIEHKTFYELRVKGLVETVMGVCHALFTTPDDDEPPFELLEIIGKAATPHEIYFRKVLTKYIVDAFFAHKPLYVAFDTKGAIAVEAIIPEIKPIARGADEAKARKQLFYPLP